MSAHLVNVARQLIASGNLPGRTPVRSYGGKSQGAICALCGQPIASGDVEIEVASDQPPTAARLHPNCHIAWFEATQEAEPR